MITANKNAAIPYLLFQYVIETAAANEENVCPDGNEKSVGMEMSISTSGWRQQGRGRATACFNKPFPKIRQRSRDKITMTPYFLLSFCTKRAMPAAIHTAPPSPIHVKNWNSNVRTLLWIC